MLSLSLDFETSGKCNFKASHTDPSQPRPTQVGAILSDDKGTILAQLDCIMRPDNFTIDDETAKYTGITTERAYKYGIDRAQVMLTLQQLVFAADCVVAHNYNHEKLILRHELHCLNWSTDWLSDDSKKYCTMLESTSVCQIPHTNRRGYKWPKLQEAIHALFKVDPASIPWHGAHTDALWTHYLYHYLVSGIVPTIYIPR
jgi:DNA polymerase III epsilon subunit-like protein